MDVFVILLKTFKYIVLIAVSLWLARASDEMDTCD